MGYFSNKAADTDNYDREYKTPGRFQGRASVVDILISNGYEVAEANTLCNTLYRQHGSKAKDIALEMFP